MEKGSCKNTEEITPGTLEEDRPENRKEGSSKIREASQKSGSDGEICLEVEYNPASGEWIAVESISNGQERFSHKPEVTPLKENNDADQRKEQDFRSHEQKAVLDVTAGNTHTHGIDREMETTKSSSGKQNAIVIDDETDSDDDNVVEVGRTASTSSSKSQRAHFKLLNACAVLRSRTSQEAMASVSSKTVCNNSITDNDIDDDDDDVMIFTDEFDDDTSVSARNTKSLCVAYNILHPRDSDEEVGKEQTVTPNGQNESFVLTCEAVANDRNGGETESDTEVEKHGETALTEDSAHHVKHIAQKRKYLHSDAGHPDVSSPKLMRSVSLQNPLMHAAAGTVHVIGGCTHKGVKCAGDPSSAVTQKTSSSVLESTTEKDSLHQTGSVLSAKHTERSKYSESSSSAMPFEVSQCTRKVPTVQEKSVAEFTYTEKSNLVTSKQSRMQSLGSKKGSPDVETENNDSLVGDSDQYLTAMQTVHKVAVSAKPVPFHASSDLFPKKGKHVAYVVSGWMRMKPTTQLDSVQTDLYSDILCKKVHQPATEVLPLTDASEADGPIRDKTLALESADVSDQHSVTEDITRSVRGERTGRELDFSMPYPVSLTLVSPFPLHFTTLRLPEYQPLLKHITLSSPLMTFLQASEKKRLTFCSCGPGPLRYSAGSWLGLTYWGSHKIATVVRNIIMVSWMDLIRFGIVDVSIVSESLFLKEFESLAVWGKMTEQELKGFVMNKWFAAKNKVNLKLISLVHLLYTIEDHLASATDVTQYMQRKFDHMLETPLCITSFTHGLACKEKNPLPEKLVRPGDAHSHMPAESLRSGQGSTQTGDSKKTRKQSHREKILPVSKPPLVLSAVPVSASTKGLNVNMSEKLIYPRCCCMQLSAEDEKEREAWQTIKIDGRKVTVQNLGLVRFLGKNIFTFEESDRLYMSLPELINRGLLPTPTDAPGRLLRETCSKLPSTEIRIPSLTEESFIAEFFDIPEDLNHLVTPFALNQIYRRLSRVDICFRIHVLTLYYEMQLGHHCHWCLQVTPPTTQMHQVSGYEHPEGKSEPAAMIVWTQEEDMHKESLHYLDGGGGTPLVDKGLEDCLLVALNKVISDFGLSDVAEAYCACPVWATDQASFSPLTISGVVFHHITQMSFAGHPHLHCWKRNNGFFVSVAELQHHGMLNFDDSDQKVREIVNSLLTKASQPSDVCSMMELERIFLTWLRSAAGSEEECCKASSQNMERKQPSVRSSSDAKEDKDLSGKRCMRGHDEREKEGEVGKNGAQAEKITRGKCQELFRCRQQIQSDDDADGQIVENCAVKKMDLSVSGMHSPKGGLYTTSDSLPTEQDIRIADSEPNELGIRISGVFSLAGGLVTKYDPKSYDCHEVMLDDGDSEVMEIKSSDDDIVTVENKSSSLKTTERENKKLDISRTKPFTNSLKSITSSERLADLERSHDASRSKGDNRPSMLLVNLKYLNMIYKMVADIGTAWSHFASSKFIIKHWKHKCSKEKSADEEHVSLNDESEAHLRPSSTEDVHPANVKSCTPFFILDSFSLSSIEVGGKKSKTIEDVQAEDRQMETRMKEDVQAEDGKKEARTIEVVQAGDGTEESRQNKEDGVEKEKKLEVIEEIDVEIGTALHPEGMNQFEMLTTKKEAADVGAFVVCQVDSSSSSIPDNDIVNVEGQYTAAELERTYVTDERMLDVIDAGNANEKEKVETGDELTHGTSHIFHESESNANCTFDELECRESLKKFINESAYESDSAVEVFEDPSDDTSYEAVTTSPLVHAASNSVNSTSDPMHKGLKQQKENTNTNRDFPEIIDVDDEESERQSDTSADDPTECVPEVVRTQFNPIVHAASGTVNSISGSMYKGVDLSLSRQTGHCMGSTFHVHLTSTVNSQEDDNVERSHDLRSNLYTQPLVPMAAMTKGILLDSNASSIGRACECPPKKNGVFDSISIQQCWRPTKYSNCLRFSRQIGQAIIGKCFVWVFKLQGQYFFNVHNLKEAGLMQPWFQVTDRQLAMFAHEHRVLTVDETEFLLERSPGMVRLDCRNDDCLITAEPLCYMSFRSDCWNGPAMTVDDIHVHQVGHICPDTCSLAHSVQQVQLEMPQITHAWVKSFHWQQSQNLQVVTETIAFRQSAKDSGRIEVESDAADTHSVVDTQSGFNLLVLATTGSEKDTDGSMQKGVKVESKAQSCFLFVREHIPDSQDTNTCSNYIWLPPPPDNRTTAKVSKGQLRAQFFTHRRRDSIFGASRSSVSNKRGMSPSQSLELEHDLCQPRFRKESHCTAFSLEGILVNEDLKSVRTITQPDCLKPVLGSLMETHSVVLMGILQTSGLIFRCIKLEGKLYINWGECMAAFKDLDSKRFSVDASEDSSSNELKAQSKSESGSENVKECDAGPRITNICSNWKATDFLYSLARKLHIFLYIVPRGITRFLCQNYRGDKDVLHSNPWVCVQSLCAMYHLSTFQTQNTRRSDRESEVFDRLHMLFVDISVKNVAFTSIVLMKATEK